MEALVSNLKKSLGDSSGAQLTRLDALWDITKAISTSTPDALRNSALDIHSALISALPIVCSAPQLRKLTTGAICSLFDVGRSLERDMPLRTIKTLTSGLSKLPKDARPGMLEALGDILRLRGLDVSSTQNDLVTLFRKQGKENSVMCEASLSAISAIIEGIPGSAQQLLPVLTKSLKNRSLEKVIHLFNFVYLCGLIFGNLFYCCKHFFSSFQLNPILLQTAEVRAKAAKCLAALNKAAGDFPTQEQRMNICIKLLDDQSEIVREEASNALFSLLLHGLSEPPLPQTPIKGNKKDAAALAAQAAAQAEQARRKAPKNLMTPILEGTFNALEPLFLKSPSRKEFRAGVTRVICKVFSTLTGTDIDANMELIVESLVNLLRSPRIVLTGQDATHSRTCVSIALRSFGSVLREVQQQRMMKLLAKTLKDKDSGELALVAVLQELCALVTEIGEAGSDMHEWLAPLIVTLLPSQSANVRFSAAACLRAIGRALPSQLASLIRSCLSEVSTHNSAIIACPAANFFTELPKHVLSLRGYGVALSALISEIDHAPLAVPNTLPKIALTVALGLLSQPTHTNFKANEAFMDVAWYIISALLGSHKTISFVLGALPQLVPYWIATFSANVSPQPRNASDVAIFIQGKVAAIWALEALLSSQQVGTFSEKLLPVLLPPLKTLLTSLPELYISFSQSPQPTTEAAISSSSSSSSSSSLSTIQLPQILHDQINMLIGGVISVYHKMPQSSGVLSSCFGLLSKLSTIISRDGPSQTTLLKSILSQEDGIVGPWPEGDPTELSSLTDCSEGICTYDSPIADWSSVWNSNIDVALSERQIPAAITVEKSIRMLALLFATQGEENQTQILSSVDQILSAKIAPQPSARYNMLNVLFASVREMNERRALVSPQGNVVKALVDCLRRFISDPDVGLSRGSAEAIGIICRLTGDSYTSAMVQSLSRLATQPGANDRVRSGCALALGNVQRYVGGIRSSSYMSSTSKLLRDLAMEPTASPTLQVSALHAYCIVIDAAGPSFPCESALALVKQILHSSSHGNSSTFRAIGDVINCVISAIGPELRPDSSTMRTTSIISELLRVHPHPLVQLESVRYYQRLIMFAPQAVSAQTITPLLEQQLSSPWQSVRQAAVTCLRQLVQGPWHAQIPEPLRISARLFAMLDSEGNRTLLEEGELVLSTLAEKLSPSAPARWLGLLCEIVLTTHSTSKNAKPPPSSAQSTKSDANNSEDSRRSKSKKGSTSKRNGDDDDDEEDEEEGERDDMTQGNLPNEQSTHETPAPTTKSSNTSTLTVPGGDVQVMDEEDKKAKQANMMTAEEVNDLSGPQNELVPRWRTKVFAMGCVHRLLETVHSLPGTEAHFNGIGKQGTGLLVDSIQDLVKLVFFAATSPIDPLRPAGVRLMRDIVIHFGKAQDSHAEGHLLLELFEVQFSSSLTRAFAADAPPLATEAACDVLVPFVTGGICLPSSAPRLIALVADRVSTLRELSFSQYSERAATIVQIGILSALARLYMLQQPQQQQQTSQAIPNEIRQTISERISRCRNTLLQLWMSFVRDYAVLTTLSPTAREGYHASFFVSPEAEEVTPCFDAAWPSILRSACAIVGSADANAQRQDFILLLGMAARDLFRLKTTMSTSSNQLQVASLAERSVECLCLLINPSHAISQKGRPPLLSNESIGELISLVENADTLLGPTHSGLRASAARFAAKLADSLPSTHFSSAPNESKGSSSLESLIRLGLSTATCKDPTQEQVASTISAVLSLSRLTNNSNTNKTTFVPIFMLAVLRCAASKSAVSNPKLLSAAVSAVSTIASSQQQDLTFLLQSIETASNLALSIPQPQDSIGLLTASSSLILAISSTGNELPICVIEWLRKSITCNHSATRLIAIEQIRTTIQSASSTPSFKIAALQFLGELGSELSLLAINCCGKIPSDQQQQQQQDVSADDTAEIKEIVRVLLLARALTPNDKVQIAMAAILPPLFALLRPTARPGSNLHALHTVAFQVVMHLAGSSAAEFRGFLTACNPNERIAFETALRQSAEAAAAAQQAAAAAEAAKQASKPKPLSFNFSKFS